MVRKFLKNCRKPQGFIGRIVANNMNRGHAAISNWGISHLKTNKDAHVLDIGCGGGANIGRFLEICPQGYVYGIDYSEESVSVSRKNNAAALGKRCEIVQGSVSKLPYENESLDVVTAFETVYFWPDIANDFSEVFRVLKHGGQFLICNELCDPSNTTWTDKIDGMKIYGLDALTTSLINIGFTVKNSDINKKGWGCIIAEK